MAWSPTSGSTTTWRPARDGVGLTTVAYLAVAPEGRTEMECIVVNERSATGLARLTDAIHETGAKIRNAADSVLGTLVLEMLDGRIQTIRGVFNPDKLGHVGPVGDAWAVDREAKQARRNARLLVSSES